jgi:hypothetical protein
MYIRKLSARRQLRFNNRVDRQAGDLAFEEKGFGIMASDVVEMIPYALKRHHPAYAKQFMINSRF